MKETNENYSPAQPNEQRKHYVFQCQSLHDTQRPKGNKISDGCGRWCIKSSPDELRFMHRGGKKIGQWTILQGRCTNHPENVSGARKQRLNQDYQTIRKCPTLREAKFLIDALNGELDKPQPNKNPQGLSLMDIEVPAPLGEKSVKVWGDTMRRIGHINDEERFEREGCERDRLQELHEQQEMIDNMDWPEAV